MSVVGASMSFKRVSSGNLDSIRCVAVSANSLQGMLLIVYFPLPATLFFMQLREREACDPKAISSVAFTSYHRQEAVTL